MHKIIVFDLGGTLMQYVGMPSSWVVFYRYGFNAINSKYGCNASLEKIEQSIAILTEYNPRIKYREIEYTPEYIFGKALQHWQIEIPIIECINTFYEGLSLKAEIFSDSLPIINKLKEKGYIIAAFTDLPTAMPDDFFKKDIHRLVDCIDYYVSSLSCGYRKPNCKGLTDIAKKYNVPVADIIFVGDEEKDKLTAQNAGCKFIQIDRTCRKKESIFNLYELLKLL